MNREQKVIEILKHAEKIGVNTETLYNILAFTNDKGLTKFHKDFLLLKKE